MDIPNAHMSGYCVIEKEDTVHHRIGLAVAVKDNDGCVIEERPAFRWWDDTEESYPQRERVRLMVDSICRYTNSGDWFTVNWNILHKDFDELPRCWLPKEWKLWQTSNDEHIYEHESKQRYLRVVEGEFTEELTRAEFVEHITGMKPMILEIAHPYEEANLLLD